MLGSKTTPHFQQFRLPRYSTEDYPDSLVELQTAGGSNVVNAKPLNFSKYGLAFQVNEAAGMPFDRLQQIDRLRFKAFGKTFFEGKVDIKHAKQNEGRYVVGVFTREKAIEVEDVLGSRIAYQIIHGKNGYSTTTKETKVSEEFQLVVAQYRDYLGSIKNSLDKTEQEISLLPLNEKDRIGISVLKSLEEEFRNKSDHFLNRVADLCRSLSGEEALPYKSYFQSHLHDFILLCPFGKRCVDKPLGYSGDYEVMNMIYGNHYIGNSLFAKLENRYWCTISAARANIDRLNFLKTKIETTVASAIKNKKTVKITSLGSGPSKEICDFIDTNPLSEQCIFTCVDLEPKALEYSKQTITEMAAKRHRNVQVNFVLANVVSYLRADPPEFMFDQDLIYASGLFDYLKHSAGQRLAESTYPLLRKGGELVLVNASISNPSKLGMEFAGEWYVNHRTKEEMLNLVSGLKERHNNLDIFLDKESVYWFLSLSK